jgi:transcriptional regulator with XRE-family HTH domain
MMTTRSERRHFQDVGILGTKRRRTPGLRREEVAELAGISVDWYMRLEQGRNSLPSKKTAESLARALKLSAMDWAHLVRFTLSHSGRTFRTEVVPLHVTELLRDLSVPAYIIGARYDLLDWNQAAIDVFQDNSKIPEAKRNMLYLMFATPGARKRFPRLGERCARDVGEFSVIV